MTTTLQPVIGQVYMAYRIYNSKRMVWEPFHLLTDRGAGNVYRYGGTWLMDNRAGSSASTLKTYDPKWTARKVCDLEREIKLLQDQISNLKNINA